MKKPNNSILVDKQIIELANSINLISPFDVNLLSGCSYDIRVGSILTSRNRTTQINLDNNGYIIESGECITIETLEEFNFRDKHLFGIITNKHSILGNGLFHPITTIDPGFKGKLAITFIHWGHIPYSIKKGDKICCVYFHYLSEEPERIYGVNLSPSVKEGSTNFALLINQPEETKNQSTIKFNYGKPFTDLQDKVKEIEEKIKNLDGQSELTFYKKEDEKQKDNKIKNRWLIGILLTIIGLLLGYVLFGGLKLLVPKDDEKSNIQQYQNKNDSSINIVKPDSNKKNVKN